MNPKALFDFVLVARHGGLRASGRADRRSASTLARHVSELESSLGVRLFERDERSFELTSAGRTLLDRLVDPVRQIMEAAELTAAENGSLRGALKVSAPVVFAHAHLARIAASFCLRHPHVALEIVADDRLIDPIADRYDLMVRANPGVDARLVGRCIVRTDRVAVCAPDLDLKQDAAAPLVFRTGELPADFWRLSTPSGLVRLALRPRLSLSTLLMMREAVLRSAGVALLPRTLIDEDLREGRLMELGVLVDAPTEIWVLRTNSRHPTAKVTAFMDHLCAEMRQRACSETGSTDRAPTRVEVV